VFTSSYKGKKGTVWFIVYFFIFILDAFQSIWCSWMLQIDLAWWISWCFHLFQIPIGLVFVWLMEGSRMNEMEFRDCFKVGCYGLIWLTWFQHVVWLLWDDFDFVLFYRFRSVWSSYDWWKVPEWTKWSAKLDSRFLDVNWFDLCPLDLFKCCFGCDVFFPFLMCFWRWIEIVECVLMLDLMLWFSQVVLFLAQVPFRLSFWAFIES